MDGLLNYQFLGRPTDGRKWLFRTTGPRNFLASERYIFAIPRNNMYWGVTEEAQTAELVRRAAISHRASIFGESVIFLVVKNRDLSVILLMILILVAILFCKQLLLGAIRVFDGTERRRAFLRNYGNIPIGGIYMGLLFGDGGGIFEWVLCV